MSPAPRGSHTRAHTQTSPTGSATRPAGAHALTRGYSDVPKDADTLSPGIRIILPEVHARVETESDCGPTGALAPRGAQRPSDRQAQRPGAQQPRPGRACRPLPASDSSRLPGREFRGGARQPAAPRPQLRCPRWRPAAATGPHVPRAPPAPPSSLPRPAQAGAGRTLDRPWHRPSRQDPHHRATRAGTPGR